MSVNSQINRINGNISDAYDELELLGADMPSVLNSNNLSATIASLNGKYYTKDETDSLLAEKSDTDHTHIVVPIFNTGAGETVQANIYVGSTEPTAPIIAGSIWIKPV